ncbi:MAG TPA: hypothetical protein VGG28_03780, partial [Kofleriaceae bacterium]
MTLSRLSLLGDRVADSGSATRVVIGREISIGASACSGQREERSCSPVCSRPVRWLAAQAASAKR